MEKEQFFGKPLLEIESEAIHAQCTPRSLMSRFLTQEGPTLSSEENFLEDGVAYLSFRLVD